MFALEMLRFTVGHGAGSGLGLGCQGVRHESRTALTDPLRTVSELHRWVLGALRPRPHVTSSGWHSGGRSALLEGQQGAGAGSNQHNQIKVILT